MFNDKIVLITGGTGTIGKALVEYLLINYKTRVIRIYSRDETKQISEILMQLNRLIQKKVQYSLKMK